jgi:FkbM family methyltransferase
MKKHISSLFKKMGRIMLNISRSVYVSAPEARVRPWIQCSGDKTLRQEYDLDRESVVFDLGAYDGQWASDMFSRYLCKIYCFEPHPKFYEKINQRFHFNDQVAVFGYGLGPERKSLYLSDSDTSSSLFSSNADAAIQVEITEACDFLKTHHISQIDLLKINIEGAEYDLIEHFLNNGLIESVGNLQVQFHDFVPDAKDRMLAIRNRLSETHFPTYVFDFVWENWKRKS